jgi:outer membrane receptor protein involved in Fe transport
MKSIWLLSVAMVAAPPALAQDAAPAAPEADAGEIIVTATRRSQSLADVPLAVSAVTADALQNSGASDIRALNQLSPSLLVSSTSSEAGAGVARIRGIGTVGDNPGLESSVATFIDGVYRNRSGVALTELGAVERIEVLRGPQGTLFGRNASAGLINVVTARPKFDSEGYASFSYGNFDAIRAEAGFTGPIGKGESLAARVDGVYFRRDGFLKDVISGREINNRDRWLVRGQLLWAPTDDLDFRIIGDYADRNEECCGAIYAPLLDRVRPAGTPAGQIGDVALAPSVWAPIQASLRDPAGNFSRLLTNFGNRETAITPGRDYRSDVTDWGVSAEMNWRLGFANLTSITAYRDWRWLRNQDADFNNLDLFYRDGYKQTFRTFTQEVRLQGTLFDDRIDWLVGGYFANEELDVRDRLRFGENWDEYGSRFLAFVNPALAAFPRFRYAGLPQFVDAGLAAQGLPAPVRGLITAQVQPLDLNDVGETQDDYAQTSRNFAFFTHNQISLTERLGITLGLRYTNERKDFDATLRSDNQGCASIRASAGRVGALASTPPFAGNPALQGVPGAVAAQLLGLQSIPCLVNLNTTIDGTYEGRKKEDEFSGTAVVSFKASDQLLVYGSYSRGYKAGGFNLDRSALNPATPRTADLLFEPEIVDAYEVGAKFNTRRFDMNVALFQSNFSNFQLNTFNGLFFIVENVQACADDLATPATGSVFGACGGDLRAGVRSRGIEVESFFSPHRTVQVGLGLTYAKTEYRDRLTGFNGRALTNDLFRLPGRNLSNAPEYVVTASAGWTPDIGSTGWSGLLYADMRWQSDYNTGSDLDIEKLEQGFVVANARIGVRGPDERFSVELWSQNLFDEKFTQVSFDMPLQPIGGVAGSRVTERPAGSAFAANRSTALFGKFQGEPRTWGVTLRTKF